MATATYDHAPEVQAIAETLIAEHHPHLQGVPIRYVYVDPPPKSKGKTVWGRARKKGPLDAHLAELEETDFFVIEAAQAVWEEMTHAQRVALVDHELCHCGLSDKGKLTLLAHDLEEFNAVVQRRGLWRDSVKVFVRAGAAADRQLGLELDDAAGPGLQLTDYGQAEVAKLTRTCSECGARNGPGNRQVSFPPPVEGEADRCCGCGGGATISANGKSAAATTPPTALIPPRPLQDQWRILSAKSPDTMLLLRHPGEDWWLFGADATNAAELSGREADTLYIGSDRLPILRVPLADLGEVYDALVRADCQVESHELAPAEEAAVA
jgi:predicted metallopeptidase